MRTLLAATIFLFLYLFYPGDEKRHKVVKVESSDFPIKFYHKFYIDQRYPGKWKLRIFSMNPCVPSNFYLPAKAYSKNETISLQFFGRPTETDCPWHWAKSCYYNSYIFEAEVGNIPEKLQVFLGSERVIEFTKMGIVTRKKKAGLTICVQPVYFYSELHNILLFIEAWKSQGATNFIVFYHSGTSQIRKLLKYYANLGTLRIIPWPRFGDLPPSIRYTYPSVDSSSYRSGHTMAQNLCVLEMDTEFGAISDFDEILVASNQTTTLQRVREEFGKNEKLGAVSFAHYFVKFYPKIETLDFHGISNPIFMDKKGPPKLIFRTLDVDVLLTHSINTFIDGRKYAKTLDSAALLHYRQNAYTELAPDINLNFTIFPKQSSFSRILRIQRTIKKLFKIRPIPNHDLIKGVKECIHDLVELKICRSTVWFCEQKMRDLSNDWSFVQNLSEEIFV